ncbi:MAG: hypothetical protein A3F82_05095 [Deltaproteobacteria bacterium RIFCSPLOWO2_12_FULL_44_12]|nr:MAG: hypothetical protein A2712_06145 [Deltaproteobacteria bacterium RIFCSPHIGHO2_01_FULL_43_49]OGQ16709.1 MAG: hypothetical protein A3D22_07270 [Deltaproteobacteria bacterium RIFCSPHIGHO2_02_FULL_44_53]OGQ29847.1 MAG: hypothetical protein A3D98_09935 [Deltaproteobacteria bacterium RIFCSPHIGHO2_12_FULL_44_21]OGQ33137.1 MAG: hypothetical protein A2979_03915 [Deltaproteobacteria bacterium RIFCSPLOWO2_01_FULL_45_74]OGQ42232.1 MAG: hypothetical protein A3I70_06220 [Deltaproteobacteria bacterium 
MKTLKKWQGLSLRVFVGAPNKTPQQTLRATHHFFTVFMVLITTAGVAFAQAPSLNLPEMPKQSLTVIFKDITKHDQFKMVMQAIKQSKRVSPFVMKRAQRGYIEYEGKFFGESESFLEMINQAVLGKLRIDSKPKGGEGLEITVTSQGS